MLLSGKNQLRSIGLSREPKPSIDVIVDEKGLIVKVV
jgi:hypothetical protein